MNPQISIVVTCYNYGQFVAGCLASIQNQTFSNFEVIVVDDGSSDNSVEQIQPFLQDKRFRCIQQENGGQANAKNRGILESTGEFVAFLDADDIWQERKLEKQMQLFKNSAVGVVFSKARLIDTNEKPVEFFFDSRYLIPRSGNVSRWLFLDNFVWFSSSVVRKDCFKTYGTFDESLAMGIDWDLWLKISTGYQFDFVNEPLIDYRIGHSGQMSKNLETRQKCSDIIMARFLSDHPRAIDDQTIRLAYYLTYCNRGEYLRKTDRGASLRHFIKAWSLMPMKKNAYKGLIKNFINWPGQKAKPINL